MRSNYRPVTATDFLLIFFCAEREKDDPPPADVLPPDWPLMIILGKYDDGTPSRSLALADAIYRLVPDFITKFEWAKNTYNAHSETVPTKRTFKGPWAKAQRCIIPAELLYEPHYDESGKSTRWAIQQAGAVPMGVAGIYDEVCPGGRTFFDNQSCEGTRGRLRSARSMPNSRRSFR